MSRTRTVLAAAVLATGALAVPAALAHEPLCDKPGADLLAEGHDLLPVGGEGVHLVEETYCSLPG